MRVLLAFGRDIGFSTVYTALYISTISNLYYSIMSGSSTKEISLVKLLQIMDGRSTHCGITDTHPNPSHNDGENGTVPKIASLAAQPSTNLPSVSQLQGNTSILGTNKSSNTSTNEIISNISNIPNLASIQNIENMPRIVNVSAAGDLNDINMGGLLTRSHYSQHQDQDQDRGQDQHLHQHQLHCRETTSDVDKNTCTFALSNNLTRYGLKNNINSTSISSSNPTFLASAKNMGNCTLPLSLPRKNHISTNLNTNDGSKTSIETFLGLGMGLGLTLEPKSNINYNSHCNNDNNYGQSIGQMEKQANDTWNQNSNNCGELICRDKIRNSNIQVDDSNNIKFPRRIDNRICSDTGRGGSNGLTSHWLGIQSMNGGQVNKVKMSSPFGYPTGFDDVKWKWRNDLQKFKLSQVSRNYVFHLLCQNQNCLSIDINNTSTTHGNSTTKKSDNSNSNSNSNNNCSNNSGCSININTTPTVLNSSFHIVQQQSHIKNLLSKRCLKFGCPKHDLVSVLLKHGINIHNADHTLCNFYSPLCLQDSNSVALQYCIQSQSRVPNTSVSTIVNRNHVHNENENNIGVVSRPPLAVTSSSVSSIPSMPSIASTTATTSTSADGISTSFNHGDKDDKRKKEEESNYNSKRNESITCSSTGITTGIYRSVKPKGLKIKTKNWGNTGLISNLSSIKTTLKKKFVDKKFYEINCWSFSELDIKYTGNTTTDPPLTIEIGTKTIENNFQNYKKILFDVLRTDEATFVKRFRPGLYEYNGVSRHTKRKSSNSNCNSNSNEKSKMSLISINSNLNQNQMGTWVCNVTIVPQQNIFSSGLICCVCVFCLV